MKKKTSIEKSNTIDIMALSYFILFLASWHFNICWMLLDPVCVSNEKIEKEKEI